MDFINKKLDEIKLVNKEASEKVQNRLDTLTKPQGSLGVLEELAKRFAAIRGTDNLICKKKVIVTFAGDHGIADEGVSAFPKEVTAHMVSNFLNGGAAINVLGRHNNIDIVVVDIGVAHDFSKKEGLVIKKVSHGTENFAKGSAMTREQAIKSISTGINIADEWTKKGVDIFGTGDMGIANTTSSSAIISAISGKDPEEVTGKGTGITDKALKHKIEVIKKGLKINNPSAEDPIDVLTKVGGFEIGGIAGLIIGAASNRVPVVIDGLISGAGALIAVRLKPAIKDYIFTSHQSVELGHKIIFDAIGQQPLFDFNMRLGEGTGSAIAIGVVESAIKLLKEMATFAEAEVAEAH